MNKYLTFGWCKIAKKTKIESPVRSIPPNWKFFVLSFSLSLFSYSSGQTNPSKITHTHIHTNRKVNIFLPPINFSDSILRTGPDPLYVLLVVLEKIYRNKFSPFHANFSLYFLIFLGFLTHIERDFHGHIYIYLSHKTPTTEAEIHPIQSNR